jgi:hypothetical protein
MKTFFARLSIIVFFTVFPSACLAIDAWPGGAGTTVATYSDASGVVWHDGRQSLFIVQNSGTLTEINSSGIELNSWPVTGDLEGITLAENDRYLYIGIENPDSIVEFDLQTEELTGKSWDLTTWMTGPDNSGLEGLSYSDGFFYAGLQADGIIYVFDVNLNVSGDVSFVRPITPNASYTSDISGLEYNSSTGITYVAYDSYNALIEMNAADEMVKNYSLPGTAQEGFAMKSNCMSRVADVYIANDDSGTIVKYANYPITCLDADEDGVNYTADCNDYDATISTNINYYRDADGDGLGSNAATSFCSLTAPSGYVTNSNDQNDNDFDNDGSLTGIDCNDSDNSISQNQTYYRDFDGDGLGDANTTTQSCSFATSEGYVTNSSDPADIYSSGRMMEINGINLDLFGIDVTSIRYIDLDYFSDGYQEVIAVGLTKKRTYITVARVNGNSVTIAKRRMVKKKYRTASITTQISKNKFVTRFNGKKKYTWKMKSSGSFAR